MDRWPNLMHVLLFKEVSFKRYVWLFDMPMEANPLSGLPILESLKSNWRFGVGVG